MRNNSRFYIGLAGVTLVVTFLIWTGFDKAMVYYLTPVELMAKVTEDDTFHDIGVKVSGRVVKGSYQKGDGAFEHYFSVADLAREDANFRVEYRDILPDTFSDETEVVVEGRFRRDGVFEATTVLTKCGSRYEAVPDEMAG
jgi:cytochrome c-type biogenesis protein CcmE